MKLPVPILIDGNKFTDAKIGEASAGVLAAARREAESGDDYTALLEWDVGVVREFSGDGMSVDVTADIRRILRFAPFETVHAIACYGMAETKGDDSIPGEYQCPKCGRVLRLSKREIDGEIEDMTDHLKAMEFSICDNPEDGISITLQKPVELTRKDTGEVIETVESIVMEWPTLAMLIRCHQRNPDDENAMQFSTFAEATRSVNGKPVDANWRMSRGDLIYKRMSVRDLATLSDAMKKHSINMKKERVCMKCKTHWDAEVDLRGFFASGLSSA